MSAKKKEKKGATIFEGSLAKEDVAAEKEQFLEAEEHEKALDAETADDVELKMHVGEKEADVYSEEGREELEEDDELGGRGVADAGAEEGFMKGAAGVGAKANCAHCGKVLTQNLKKVVEREIGDELKAFCSNACAAKCAEQHKAR